MKTITCERLIDSNTGESLKIEIPDDISDEHIKMIRMKAWESGARFRIGLEAMEESKAVKN
jgi:hypothetical protein